MTVHFFGAVSFPTTCIFALRHTAEDFGHLYPNVANKVLNNIYVDNYLDCTETEEEAITLRQDVSALLKLGGFNMVQWLTSSRSVLATVDKNDLSLSLDLDADFRSSAHSKYCGTVKMTFLFSKLPLGPTLKQNESKNSSARCLASRN
jgi:hypothetical protein